MRYIDSGKRDSSQALATWFQTILLPNVSEVRWQCGYFTSAPLGLFSTTLERIVNNGQTVKIVIGSNDASTQQDDVLLLVQLLGLPKTNVHLGVVQYDNALFHPKTYHFRRVDGSQCAYVGSANFTSQGIGSLNVEAGTILDTNEGDSSTVLDQIASAIDAWFSITQNGMHKISSLADVHQLVSDGVLIVALPPTPPGSRAGSGSGSSSHPSARLLPLVGLPELSPPALPRPPISGVTRTTTRVGFPAHVLFDPVATGPTSGSNALSGNLLPHGAVGLIIRLTKDDTRLFASAVGTANINLPIDSISTLRFGVLGRGGYPSRPRAEFDMYVRYLGSRNIVLPDPVDTNVMLYGYLPGEAGHQNRRMLLPADVRELGTEIRQAGMPVPTVGHLALLEWPTTTAPEFRLSFLEPGSTIEQQAQLLFASATGTSRMLADNSCVMGVGVSPSTPW